MLPVQFISAGAHWQAFIIIMAFKRCQPERNYPACIVIACWIVVSRLCEALTMSFMRRIPAYFGVKREDVLANPHLMLLAESDEAGCYLIKDDQGNIYLLGHPEYDRMSLDAEYKRDLAKGMDAEVPVHYYENDDPSTTPLLTWRGHANTLYTNWLNFYVYQATPYKW